VSADRDARTAQLVACHPKLDTRIDAAVPALGEPDESFVGEISAEAETGDILHEHESKCQPISQLESHDRRGDITWPPCRNN
jgi:hypothetical protein